MFIALCQLRSCFSVGPSLTRERVCLLYMLLALDRVVFSGPSLLSQILDFPFRRLLRLAGSRWRYSNPPPHGWGLVSKLKSKLCYDRRSVGQSVLVSSTHLGLTTRFLLVETVAGLLMWDALSDERTGLPFTIAAGPRQRVLSWVRVPRESWPYFTVSNSRLPQPEGTGPRIYIPQEEGGPVIPPGTGFPFRRLLLLAGLWWRYLNPPSRGFVNFLLAQEIQSESESHCGWRSVSLSVLVSSSVWGLA
jgi:hypothetical protein